MTVSELNLLSGPYGWDSYDGACISLTTVGEVNEDALERVLLSYSCHPPAIPTIKSVLRHSNRYDCILQATWYRGQRKMVTRDLAGIGVTLHHRGYLKDLRKYV